jgi:RHS repeat-associated protein
VTSRTYPATTTGTLAYDGQDQFVRWQGTTASTKQGEWYLYDASGNRVLRRSASTDLSGNPATAAATITVYAFGLEEHSYQYAGSGTSLTPTGNTYYYDLGGQLLGTLSGTTTQSTSFLLTDALGSVVASISNTAGSAQVLGNQLYGPYGNKRYTAGSVGTDKGFTGQYADDLTGLDYYRARYYDPVIGRFLSADIIEGNAVGLDPYDYVGGNPETDTDPTGELVYNPGSGETVNPITHVIYTRTGVPEYVNIVAIYNQTASYHPSAPPSHSGSGNQSNSATDWSHLGTASHTSIDTQITVKRPRGGPHVVCLPYCMGLWGGGGDITFRFRGSALNYNHWCISLIACLAEGSDQSKGEEESSDPGFGCSFTPTTEVATDRGKKAIGSLHTGEQVWAYNPKTHKMELQPIEHVWIHKDDDLVDLTISTPMKGLHGKVGPASSEVIHTNKKHPFLTIEKGFLPVGQITVGMHVIRADGRIGVITAWKIVPGVIIWRSPRITPSPSVRDGGSCIMRVVLSRMTLSLTIRKPVVTKSITECWTFGQQKIYRDTRANMHQLWFSPQRIMLQQRLCIGIGLLG